jgi:hypothetical protein
MLGYATTVSIYTRRSMMRAWTGLALLAACASPGRPRDLPARLARPPTAPPRSWRPVTAPAPFDAAQPLLLTDGTVMVQELSTEQFWRLTPDASGSYEHGTWSPRAAAPAGYSPLYDASAVLPDGRVIVMGGEYLGGFQAWTTRGALYDPVADSWVSMPAPAGWTQIGDASGIVLPDGRFLLSSCCTADIAILDARALTWQPVGQGKLDVNDEESWVLLPDGTILTVDANNLADRQSTEIYHPDLQRWIYAGDTPTQLDDLQPNGGGSHEVGPNVLRADGTVLAMGGTGHNAIYDTATKQWSQAPDLPIANGQQLDMADAPAALLPNGDVLLLASPGVFQAPSQLFEWNGQAFTDTASTPDCAAATSYQFSMLLLPTGEVLMTDQSPDVELYTPAPGLTDSAIPIITGVGEVGSALRSGSEEIVIELYPDHVYELAGQRLAGVSQGGFYGDDVQTATNFPIVRLTTSSSGHVRYLRTHDHSSLAIGSDTDATTRFDVPGDIEPGPGTLEVVVNGIASPAIGVDVK